jgi:oligopeptide transport system permease protein
VLKFTIKRLLGAIPTMLLITTVAFFLMRAAPGGPFDKERVVQPEIEAALKHEYHLDEPISLQFFHYVWNLLHGDFGPSFQYRDFTVTELIRGGFPTSLLLGSLAMLLALVIGSGVGIICAMRQNSRLDYTVMGISMTGIMIPNFVIAPLLTLVFGLMLHWLPVGGWGDGDVSHIVLPVIALALYPLSSIARLMRGSMIEILRTNYLRTARAKGLPERITITAPCPQGRHAAGHLLSRARRGEHHHRLDRHRADLRHPGHRPLFRPGGAEPRLHAGDGRHGLLWRAHHPGQSAGRPDLWPARSQSPIRLSPP